MSMLQISVLEVEKYEFKAYIPPPPWTIPYLLLNSLIERIPYTPLVTTRYFPLSFVWRNWVTSVTVNPPFAETDNPLIQEELLIWRFTSVTNRVYETCYIFVYAILQAILGTMYLVHGEKKCRLVTNNFVYQQTICSLLLAVLNLMSGPRNLSARNGWSTHYLFEPPHQGGIIAHIMGFSKWRHSCLFSVFIQQTSGANLRRLDWIWTKESTPSHKYIVKLW